MRHHPHVFLPKLIEATSVYHPNTTPVEMGMPLLEKLSHILTDTALYVNEEKQPKLYRELPSPLGAHAFLHPTVELQRGSTGRRRVASTIEMPTVCMEYHKAKANGSTCFNFDVDGPYMKVYLGRNKHSQKPVMEYAHRIVAWAMFGPPLEGQEVMHVCNNPKCLSPMHLKYGGHAENMLAQPRKARAKRKAPT